jgi:hypothetical protein
MMQQVKAINDIKASIRELEKPDFEVTTPVSVAMPNLIVRAN